MKKKTVSYSLQLWPNINSGQLAYPSKIIGSLLLEQQPNIPTLSIKYTWLC